MREQLLVVCLCASAMPACRAGAPEHRLEQQLRDSFVRQITSTAIVRDVRHDGDNVSFSARHGSQLDAKWRVHTYAVTMACPAGAAAPSKGRGTITGDGNGQAVRTR